MATIFAAAFIWVNLYVNDRTLGYFALATDSSGYFFHNLARTPTYYWLLCGLEALGLLSHVVTIQLNLLLAALCFFAITVGKLVNNRAVGVVLFVLLACDTMLLTWSSFLMTECLFAAAILVYFAFLLRSLPTFHWRDLLLAGIALGAAAQIRPAGFFFLPSLVAVALTSGRRRWWKAIAAGAAPAAVLWLATAAYNGAVLGVFGTTAVGGLDLAGQAGHLIDRGATPGSPELGERIQREVSPLAASFLGASYPEQHWLQSFREYDQALWFRIYPELLCEIYRTEPTLFSERRSRPAPDWVVASVQSLRERPEVRQELAAFCPALAAPGAAVTRDNLILYLFMPAIFSRIGATDLGKDVPGQAYFLDPIPAAAVNRLALKTALGAIREHPFAYAIHVGAHVYGLWRSLFLVWDNTDADYARTAAARSGTPIDTQLGAAVLSLLPTDDSVREIAARSARDRYALDLVWREVVSWPGTLSICAAALSLALIVLGAACGSSRPEYAGLGCLALALWTYFIFVALMIYGVERYAVMVEPLAMTVLVGGLFVMARDLQRSLRGKWRPAPAIVTANS